MIFGLLLILAAAAGYWSFCASVQKTPAKAGEKTEQEGGGGFPTPENAETQEPAEETPEAYGDKGAAATQRLDTPEATTSAPRDADYGSWDKGSTARPKPGATPIFWGMQFMLASNFAAGVDAVRASGLKPGQVIAFQKGQYWAFVYLHKAQAYTDRTKVPSSAKGYPAIKKAQRLAGARIGSGFRVEIPETFLQFDLQANNWTEHSLP